MLVVAAVFIVGLFLHLGVFIEPHVEGDELIYKTLVAQLENGNGYTLHGSALLEHGGIDKPHYDRPLFFHPPGGIALFWLFHRWLGDWGLPTVQVLSYVLFFWSMLLIADPLGLSSSSTGVILLTCLTVFNPILSHVTTKFWLDGPLLAFSTLAVAVFIRAVVRTDYVWACIAGAILGYASLIKMTAFLVIPGAAALAWFLIKPSRWRTFLWLATCLIVPAVLIQLPWEIWQWMKVGSAFPGGAGEPTPSILEHNEYVYYLTVTRPAWIYLILLPQILSTLIPSITLYFLLCDRPRIKRQGLACLLWIAAILVPHIVLGSMGYSKLVRYVILLVPASIALFSTVMTEAIARLRMGIQSPIRNGVTWIATVAGAIAFSMEIATGIASSLHRNYDLVFPIFVYLFG